MTELEMERIYTIPLRKVKAGSRNKMANRAVREVRDYLSRHMKSDDVWLDAAVNEAIWARGMYMVPSKLRVRAVKFDDGVVEVSLPEEEATTSIRETLKSEREAKAPILAREVTEEDVEGVAEGAGIEAEPETAEIEAEPEAAAEADAAQAKAAKATKKQQAGAAEAAAEAGMADGSTQDEGRPSTDEKQT